ncbi:MAG: glycosyltransferase family 9 protein [Deltaproteobacteria bacterium]|nr:glycosyltransferase family 9 protein [Deltaproteobacteria bacterium]MBN2686874.1 glycosyltransferase family 9 protein [Deltaproteobacteria bacterium]
MKENITKILIWLLSKGSQAVRSQRKPPDPDTVRRIVVLQMSGIGDLLLITPALRALHRMYPLAKIDIITYKLSNADFLFRFPYIGGGFEFPLFNLELKSFWRPSFWQSLRKPLHFVNNSAPDLYINFHHTWLPQWYLFELLVAARCGARFKIGINPDYVSGSGVFDRSVTEALLGSRHYCPFFMDIVNLLGEASNDYSPEFPLEPHEIEEAKNLIHSAIPHNRKIVCIHAGASFNAQRWPVDRFSELAKMLVAHGCGIVLIGTADESHVTEFIMKMLPERKCLNAAGKTNLYQMAALIDRCDLFIGNDSGPMHIAISRKCPTIGLIGPGKPRYHRYEQNGVVMMINPILPDMHEDKTAVFPWQISAEEVYEKAKGLLS